MKIFVFAILILSTISTQAMEKDTVPDRIIAQLEQLKTDHARAIAQADGKLKEFVSLQSDIDTMAQSSRLNKGQRLIYAVLTGNELRVKNAINKDVKKISYPNGATPLYYAARLMALSETSAKDNTFNSTKMGLMNIIEELATFDPSAIQLKNAQDGESPYSLLEKSHRDLFAKQPKPCMFTGFEVLRKAMGINDSGTKRPYNLRKKENK